MLREQLGSVSETEHRPGEPFYRSDSVRILEMVIMLEQEQASHQLC